MDDDRPLVPTIYFLEKVSTMQRMVRYLQDETDPARADATLATITQLANALRDESEKWRRELQPATLSHDKEAQ